MEQQGAGHYGSLNAGRRVPSLWEGLSLIMALGELALLTAHFPLVAPVTIGCDNNAVLSLCKDRKEGQQICTSTSSNTLRRIMWHVESQRLCTASLRTM
jgi:hypothetical protein